MAGKKKIVQVGFTEPVYLRLTAMAEMRGVTVATYVSYVAAESSMASAALMESLGNFTEHAVRAVSDAGEGESR